MKILVVDDEPLARARVIRMLTTLGYKDIFEATNADKAIAIVRQNEIDLVLLDINMPGVSGIELGHELKYLKNNIAIIFQTAYEEHALEAFEIGAVGYLVKPFSIDQLSTTLSRVVKESDSSYKMMSKNGEHYYLLKPEDIFYIKADLAEVILRTSSGFSYSAQKISDLEDKLSSYGFIRIHRSYLINPDKIKEMTTIEQSKLRFSFSGINDEIDSSKDGAKEFRNLFSN
ncbi:MAG: LytTR family DNA-binding domain-containing protein [Thiovulaceae bacterium]|nr:LytTR family DNA-binding domain-containing protein [Sulfurimonadaceae bacterium]